MQSNRNLLFIIPVSLITAKDFVCPYALTPPVNTQQLIKPASF